MLLTHITTLLQTNTMKLQQEAMIWTFRSQYYCVFISILFYLLSYLFHINLIVIVVGKHIYMIHEYFIQSQLCRLCSGLQNVVSSWQYHVVWQCCNLLCLFACFLFLSLFLIHLAYIFMRLSKL